jgi:hypothetical protein
MQEITREGTAAVEIGGHPNVSRDRMPLRGGWEQEMGHR